MGSKSYKAPYLEAQRVIREKDKLISELQGTISTIQTEQAKKDEQYASSLSEKDTNITELEEDKEQFEEKISSLETSLTRTEEQLRNKELNRFAGEYKKEEERYETQQRDWFWYSVYAGGIALAIAIFTSFNAFEIVITYFGGLPSADGSRLPAVEVVFLNAIALTVFIYCLKQHSHLADLREDYANRKALAQSYQYMVEDKEDKSLSEIKNKFFDRAIEVFTKKPRGRGSDVTWYETTISKFFGPKP